MRIIETNSKYSEHYAGFQLSTIANVPQELRDYAQWVTWNYEDRGGRRTKVPYNPATGERASVTAEATWGTFEQAFGAAHSYEGIGFVVTENDPFCGIDLDKCIDPETGEISKLAANIVDRFSSYTERTPSGTGLRVWVRGELPAGSRRTKGIEVYDSARFFTVTGNALRALPIEGRQAGLDEWHAEIFPQSGERHERVEPTSPTMSDERVLELATRAKNGAKVRRLLEGNIEGFESHSEADAGLLALLAFYTQDAEQLERLWLESGLNRQKLGREDYRERTLDFILSNVSETYKGAAAKGLEYTDGANARRLIERHGENIRYCTQTKTWYVWNGCRWVVDSEAAIMELAKETVQHMHRQATESMKDSDSWQALARWAVKSFNKAPLQGMVTLAQTDRDVTISLDELDTNPHLLNCLNGTVDLQTGELLPHSREHYITKSTPVNYEPNARLELWEDFLEWVTGGDAEYREFLQRAAGYSVTGLTREEKFFFIHGPKSSGKSTFMSACKNALGRDYGATANFETFLRHGRGSSQGREDIARLHDKRWVASIEVDKGERLAEGIVKTMTGGDTIAARFMYRGTFEFTPEFKLWLVANDVPEVSHEDDAMWRRILKVPFNHSVPADKRDDSVKARLTNPEIAGEAILAWIVAGAVAWYRDGLNVPEIVTEQTQELREEMNPLHDFIAEVCELGRNATCGPSELFNAYKDWHYESGTDADRLNRSQFKSTLESMGHRQEKGTAGARLWHGIGLTEKQGIPNLFMRGAA